MRTGQGSDEGHRRVLGRLRRHRRQEPASADELDSGQAGCGDGHAWPARVDWAGIQDRLAPVRHRWDLAIISNLDADAGKRPAELVEAVNSQVEGELRLTRQVLSLRLRALEQQGYVRHADLSRIPLVRVYTLRPAGRDLLRTVSAMAPWDESLPDRRADRVGR